MKQFNRAFGCPYCLQEGKRIVNEKKDVNESEKRKGKKGKQRKQIESNINKGNKRVYCVEDAPDRDQLSYLHDVDAAVRSKQAIRGIKGPCVMHEVVTLDTLRSYPPEYLHAWLLGLIRMLMEAIIDPANHNEDWYLGTQLNEINRRLLLICPPSEITRTPEKLGDK